MFDTSTETGARAVRRLREEQSAWLNTVRRAVMPQPVPVWFLWEEGSFLIYTSAEAHKLKNIRSNPRVAMNLNSGADGDDIVRAEGIAEILEDFPPPDEHPQYLEKYRRGMTIVSGNPESFASYYNTAFRVTPERWQVW